ncbi:MAG: PD-(D/E)XK nuclease family transposase [Defluviitaleaceae bacterium]|nr:PD-(D/E)XK nuclease family transposase [Defluviitaleaceae bacterium]
MNDENQPLSQNVSEVDILKELATLDPLDDRAFRILASDDEQFKILAESFSGETLDGEKIIHMNGEIVLTAYGKLIRVDSLRDVDSAFINLDGQVKTSAFPFKRHVFYTAAIYANGIQMGDSWGNLKPVISIVIYKDKGETALFQKATLAGTLIESEDDGKQLTLISVNTTKWKDAPTEELRAYLSTLHNGIMTEDNKDVFMGIDVTSEAFSKMQKAVIIACAHTKKQEYKGDDSMSAILDQYISKEAKEAAEERAFDLAQKIIRMLKENIAVADIARECNVSTQRVESLRMAVS